MKKLRLLNRGFSLIELMVGISILMILVSIAFFESSSMTTLLVRSELDLLYTTARHAQQLAMVTNSPKKLVFDVNANSYTCDGVTHALPSQVKFGAPANVMGPPSHPKHTITKPVTFAEHTMTFYPDGIIQSGTLYMTDAKRSCAYCLSSPVSQVSFLRTYRYDGKWRVITPD